MTTDTNTFVIQRADGRYLAVDQASGGYEYWTDSFTSAQLFRYDERGLFYAREAQKKEVGVFCRPVVMDKGLAVAELAERALPGLREQALAKLTKAEREALGL